MDVDWWKRAAIVAAVVLVTLVVARLADRALTRRLKHEPQAMTRYRVLRRSLVAAIIAFGVLSALLVIPGIRAVAGGILASSAVVGLVIGMAARGGGEQPAQKQQPVQQQPAKVAPVPTEDDPVDQAQALEEWIRAHSKG